MIRKIPTFYLIIIIMLPYFSINLDYRNKTYCESLHFKELITTNLTTGVNILATNDLPNFEKNRIDRNGDWVYSDRNLATLPLVKNNRYNIEPPLTINSNFSTTFGAIEGCNFVFHFYSNHYLNGTEVGYDFKGDIDLYLYNDSNYIIEKSESIEGLDEEIVFNCNFDGNYTFVAIHDALDSSKDFAAGSLRIFIDYENEVIQNIYLEDNSTSLFSTFSSSSFNIVKYTYAKPANTLDLYQVRYYSNSEVNDLLISNSNSSLNSDLKIDNWDSLYNAHYVEIEAEKGYGFSTIASTTNKKGILKVCNTQNNFIRYNILELEFSALVPYIFNSKTIEDFYIIDPIGNIKRYNVSDKFNPFISFAKFNITYIPYFEGTYKTGFVYGDSTFNSLSSFEVTDKEDSNPELKKIGFRKSLIYNTSQIYAEIINTGFQIKNVEFNYSTDDGNSFNQKNMTWLTDQYYGINFESINLSNILWNIVYYRSNSYLQKQNDANSGDDASNNFEDVQEINVGNYSGECRQFENDTIDIYKFYFNNTTKYTIVFETTGFYKISIFNSSFIQITALVIFNDTDHLIATQRNNECYYFHVEYLSGAEKYNFKVSENVEFTYTSNLIFLTSIVIFNLLILIFRKKKQKK